MADCPNSGGFWSGFVTDSGDLDSSSDKRRRTEVMEDVIETEVGPEEDPEFYLEHYLY